MTKNLCYINNLFNLMIIFIILFFRKIPQIEIAISEMCIFQTFCNFSLYWNERKNTFGMNEKISSPSFCLQTFYDYYHCSDINVMMIISLHSCSIQDYSVSALDSKNISFTFYCNNYVHKTI